MAPYAEGPLPQCQLKLRPVDAPANKSAQASPQTDPDASAQPIYFPRQYIVHGAACRPLIVARCSLLARAVALRVAAALCFRQWGCSKYGLRIMPSLIGVK